jgi:hypothetical protein
MATWDSFTTAPVKKKPNYGIYLGIGNWSAFGRGIDIENGEPTWQVRVSVIPTGVTAVFSNSV